MGFLNDGTAIFGKEQTVKLPKTYSNSSRSYSGSGTNWDQSMDWDECQELGLNIGLPGQW